VYVNSRETLRKLTQAIGCDIFAVAFIAIGLLSAVHFSVTKPDLALSPSTAVSPAQYEKRFAEVKKFLPQFGAIGYLGETGPDENPEYYLAEYALAPVIVDRSPQHALVLGNFHSSQSGLMAAQVTGLTLIHDFGNGVLLFGAREK
jgi:hypothetical protein